MKYLTLIFCLILSLNSSASSLEDPCSSPSIERKVALLFNQLPDLRDKQKLEILDFLPRKESSSLRIIVLASGATFIKKLPLPKDGIAISALYKDLNKVVRERLGEFYRVKIFKDTYRNEELAYSFED